MSASIRTKIDSAADKILSGGRIDLAEALALSEATGTDLTDLFTAAGRVREHFRGTSVDICSIVNAKSGACSEDCRLASRAESS